jgi:hypothetical protein
MNHTWKGLEVLARRLMGCPNGQLGSVASLSLDHDGIDGVRMKVAVEPPPSFIRGPRKGKPNWSKADARVRIYDYGTLEREAKTWEAETGLCYQCLGDGRTFKSWNAASGLETQTCDMCNGTGWRVGAP